MLLVTQRHVSGKQLSINHPSIPFVVLVKKSKKCKDLQKEGEKVSQRRKKMRRRGVIAHPLPREGDLGVGCDGDLGQGLGSLGPSHLCAL